MSKLLDMIVAGKKAYQAFTIQHGIEHIDVKIPIKEVRHFERGFNEAISAGTSDKSALLELVARHGGKIVKKGQ